MYIWLSPSFLYHHQPPHHRTTTLITYLHPSSIAHTHQCLHTPTTTHNHCPGPLSYSSTAFGTHSHSHNRFLLSSCHPTLDTVPRITSPSTLIHPRPHPPPLFAFSLPVSVLLPPTFPRLHHAADDRTSNIPSLALGTLARQICI